jgi:hypothetical protein
MWPFKRKNFASPYYGKGNKALFTSPMPPMQVQQQAQEELPKSTQAPVQVVKRESAEPDWELRRFELVKMLIAQERRSVVLGKLRANDKQIVAKARSIADAAIEELLTHPFKSHDEAGEKADV